MEIIEIGTKRNGETYTFRETCYGIAQSNGKTLIVFSNKDGDYSLPGGGMEKGETKEDGLKREFLEEAGYEIEKAEPLVDAHMFVRNSKGFYIERLAHFFLVKIKEGTNVTPIENWHDPIWIEDDKVLETLTHHTQIEVMKKCCICCK